LRTDKIFSREALLQMKEELKESFDTLSVPSGIEILWVGNTDNNGKITEVTPAARGNTSSVPALFPHMERGHAVIHNHPGGDLTPSGADLNIASRLGNQGIGFLIVDNLLENVFVVAEPLTGGKTRDLNEDEIINIFQPDGKLSENLETYEPREEQIELTRLIVQSFNREIPVIAEAGTGVGKSFAYLIPAVKWAGSNKQRVVISTATIALQQQLSNKDIPIVKKILGSEIKTAVVKGRSNYLCLKRLEENGSEYSLFSDGSEMADIIKWAEKTGSGSLSELPFKPSPSVWNSVCSESDNCPGILCPYFSKCFFMKSRREASDASLLIVNHHLLFADLAAREGETGREEAAVLPPYKKIILDEAHNIEKSATDLFSFSLSIPLLNKYFYRLHRKGKSSRKSLLARIAAEYPDFSVQCTKTIPDLIDSVRSAAEILDSASMNFFSSERQIKFSGKENIEHMSGLKRTLSRLNNSLSVLKNSMEETSENSDSLAVELLQTLGSLQEIELVCESFVSMTDYPEFIFWGELRKRQDGNSWVSFNRTPLSMSQTINEALWEQFGTIVSLSATMTVDGSFSFWKKSGGLSLSSRKIREGIFPSPFDFANRVMLGIPSDAPMPGETEKWQDYLSGVIFSAIEISGGHALILFTSYSTLKKTLESVRNSTSDKMENAPVILAQGEDERGRLLEKFRSNYSSVLFATDSFWEGVDVPGDALKMVIITRLPFRPPTNPVDQARREALSRKGGNPFMQISIPEAVMRFRQGFGRLIRKKSDRGAVLVLDSRIVSKYYGRIFINSLPPVFQCIKNTDGVLSDLEDFLYG